jgi:hypothetical protein
MTTDLLSKLFEEHGVSSIIENEWVVPNNELPAIRALWYPGESSGRLDVQALVQDQVVIEECFAGIGQGDRALNDAMVNFSVNSFHVLLASLWNRNDSEQVTTEQWNVGNKRYTAFIGNFGTRSSEGVRPHIPSELFSQIAKAIQHETLTERLHWFRFFVGNSSGEKTIEALRDNQPWEAGIDTLENAAWPSCQGYYSVRLFVVLRAA